MKHLKSFNEDITSFNFEEELKDFCETNLAYLLDEGRLLIEKSITLIRVQLSFDRDKDWDEIKDHMIPFLIRLEQIRFFLPRNTQVEESKSEIKKELGDNNYYQMVSGIIDILKKVKDKENRMEIANDMVKQFKRENIKFDYKKFLDELE
jgi:hypothetical protein